MMISQQYRGEMSSPSLSELPQIEKTGWPWTQGSNKLELLDYPRISIITPSYNQGQFLEETIRSVLLQNYPNLEYIVIDGGSTDNSVDIIKKYSQWLSYWVSEKDQGQSDAINKGFKKATGDIIAWINSDDYYFPNVLARVAQEISPDKQRFVIVGKCYLDNIKSYHSLSPVFSKYNLLFHYYSGQMGLPIVMPPQPAIFWHRDVWQKIGLLDESLNLTMDYEYWLRMALSYNYRFHYVPENFAYYRIHSESKSGQGWHIFAQEQQEVFKRYWNDLHPLSKIFAVIYWLTTSYLFIIAIKCKQLLKKVNAIYE